MSRTTLARDFRNIDPKLTRVILIEAGPRILRGFAEELANGQLRSFEELLSAGNLPRVFDQVLLMAPDEDDDTFEHDHKMGQLTRICSQVTVYFNRSDLALHTSDKTKGNPDRLGTDGARLPGALPAGIAQVDCSEVATGAVKHSYYVDSDKVIADAGAVLRGEHHADIGGRRPVEGMRVYRLR